MLCLEDDGERGLRIEISCGGGNEFYFSQGMAFWLSSREERRKEERMRLMSTRLEQCVFAARQV